MSEDIQWSLGEDDIEWTMHWQDRPNEQVFESDKALAHLILNEIVLIGQRHEGQIPKEEIDAAVLCNDVFAWGCADAEDLPYREIEPLYRAWRQDPVYGPTIWCCLRRNLRPQPRLILHMKEAGAWTAQLEALPA